MAKVPTKPAPCRRLLLVQRSPAWHRWRYAGLGASDIAAILGVSPYTTRAEVLAEKSRPYGEGQPEGRVETFAMRRGNRMEPVARDLFERATGIPVQPCCVEHGEQPYLRCSLDGLDFWGEILVEIKCPNVIDHEVALAGVVPVHYAPQVQYQLLVTGCERGYYASYSVTKRFTQSQQFALVEVCPDPEAMASIAEAAEAFWAEVVAARQATLTGAGV